jgi:XTP/dITP diphosphohydrolase
MNILNFASSNEDKFSELENLCRKSNIKVNFSKIRITEIQSDSLIEVAEDKAKKAFEVVKSAVIVEDDGLFIEELNGFPGIYSSFVFKSIGNKGVLKVMEGISKRNASFFSAYSYYDGMAMRTFIGETRGEITNRIFSGGWGFDPIFRPDGEVKTYGQLGISRKNEISHRSKAFKEFVDWYKTRPTQDYT